MSFDVRAHLAGEAGASEIDDKTAAALAAAAYKDFATPFPPGWDLLFEQTDDPGGYDGRALHHPASKTLILANRGTEFTSFRDWEENFGAAIFGHAGTQIPAACKLLADALHRMEVDGLAVEEVLFVGHSLGGALAEAQARLCLSYLPERLKTHARAVGVASAGFGAAIVPFAQKYQLTLHPSPESIVTHYVRKQDVVPHHPGRVSLGREVGMASLYHAMRYQPYKSPGWEYKRDCDLLANHSIGTHLQFWGDGDDCFIWCKGDDFTMRPGAAPRWSHGMREPKLADL